MNVNATEAAEALAAIEASQHSIRSFFRRHRGHAHLWIWGGVWMFDALLPILFSPSALQWAPAASVVGGVLSTIVGVRSRREVRSAIDPRFLRVVLALVAFGAVWPFVFGWPNDPRVWFAYPALLAMMIYVVAGIWFDAYLARIGFANTLVFLFGLWVVPSYFWWTALIAGAGLVATGFYIRYAWRD